MTPLRRMLFALSLLTLAVGLVGTLVFLAYFVLNFTKPGFVEPDYPGIHLLGREWKRTQWWQPVLITALGGVGMALLSGSRRSGIQKDRDHGDDGPGPVG